jgi:hypothetical protein
MFNSPTAKNLVKIIIGDYNFFNSYNFEQYFFLKYKIRKSYVYWFFVLVFSFFLTFLTFQIFFLGIDKFEAILLQCVLVFAFVHLVHYWFFFQYKQYRASVETTGYYVINELLVILDTSRSLKEATKFIILGNYELFSRIFETALYLSHFGDSLKNALQKQILRNLHGEIQTFFLHILETWEYGKNIALLSKNQILNRIMKNLIEETEKIDSWASLLSGLLFLSPPVIICFLLISGKMSFLLGILIVIALILGTIFSHPNRYLSVFSNDTHLSLSYDNKSLEFLVILAENLIRGNSYEKSLNIALNSIFLNSLNQENLNQVALFRLGKIPKTATEEFIFENVFSKRILHLITLTKKFAQKDIVIAGKKLLNITTELSEMNELLMKRKAQWKAANFRMKIIQLFALTSLAIITGTSPFFQYVTTTLTYSFNDSNVTSIQPNFDLVYFMIAMVMSFLPNVTDKKRKTNVIVRISWSDMSKVMKFMLFLLISLVARSFLRNLY